MNTTLTNQNIVIIGGTSGIGLAVAKLVAEKGANLTIASRSLERLSKAANEIDDNVQIDMIDTLNNSNLSLSIKSDRYLERNNSHKTFRRLKMNTQNKKVWFIIGSSKGFGRTLAETVLQQGDRVIPTARKPEQLQNLINVMSVAAESVQGVLVKNCGHWIPEERPDDLLQHLTTFFEPA